MMFSDCKKIGACGMKSVKRKPVINQIASDMHSPRLRSVLVLCLAISCGLAWGASLKRISTSVSGREGNGYSYQPSISGNGRYAVFTSYASNLVRNDNNTKLDIFRKDLKTGAIKRVSTDALGKESNGHSYEPSIAANGRYVAFTSDATNLVTDDDNGIDDIFVKNMKTGTIQRASTDAQGGDGNAESRLSAISADGRSVVFASFSSNLVANDNNEAWDIFIKDIETGTVQRLSTSTLGGEGNNHSYFASISADGRYVVFSSSASNLAAEDNNEDWDIFRKDLLTGEIRLVSISALGGKGNGINQSSISADGRYVAFSSNAGNLVPDDNNHAADIFRKDMLTDEIELVSADGFGKGGDNSSYQPAISANGRYVAFFSSAQNLVLHDANSVSPLDYYRKDMQTGAIERPFIYALGENANWILNKPSISANGCGVVFMSDATNLIARDNNGKSDVFRYSVKKCKP